jgi:hypothetical protein
MAVRNIPGQKPLRTGLCQSYTGRDGLPGVPVASLSRTQVREGPFLFHEVEWIPGLAKRLRANAARPG